MKYLNKILIGEALEWAKKLPTESINCVVTSPPYWGLRDYGTDKQLGIEEKPQEYIDKLCDVWVNIGDRYSGSGKGPSNNNSKQSTNAGSLAKTFSGVIPSGLKPKDLVEPCILTGCPINGIVLDPFAGSGTTLMVSRQLSRNFIGIELNFDFVKNIMPLRINSVEAITLDGKNHIFGNMTLSMFENEEGYNGRF